MNTVKEQQSHETHNHNHNHNHDHDHGKMPIILYIIGLVLALIALFLNEEYVVIKNILFSIASISADIMLFFSKELGKQLRIQKPKRNLHLIPTF